MGQVPGMNQMRGQQNQQQFGMQGGGMGLGQQMNANPMMGNQMNMGQQPNNNFNQNQMGQNNFNPFGGM